MSKVCPNCGGRRYRLTARNYRGKDHKSQDLYVCVDCTHSFPQPVEEKAEVAEAETEAETEAEEEVQQQDE